MDDEQIYLLMSGALDDVLDAAEAAELEAQLATNAALMDEWVSLQAVDHLFRATPMVAPPPTLVARTLARLPDTRVRLWWSSVLFTGLFMLGLLPVLGLAWVLAQSGVLTQPGALTAFSDALSGSFQFVEVVARSLATSMRNVALGQPLVFGWLALLLGILFTWQTVYAQFMQPVPIAVAVIDEATR